MQFDRSLEIEHPMVDVLQLIRNGRFSTPMLAEEVGVSLPTISRCVSALRVRGNDIRAEKPEDGWRYVLAGKTVGPQKPKSGHFAQTAPRIHERDHDALSP